MSTTQREDIKKLTSDLKSLGFRVFLASSGDYGFYTNQMGLKIVIFCTEGDDLKFIGCYKLDSPTDYRAWTIQSGYTKKIDLVSVFDSSPPNEYNNWQFTTIDQYLAPFQSLAQYKEA